MDVTVSSAYAPSATHQVAHSSFPVFSPFPSTKSPKSSCDHLVMRTLNRHRTQSTPLSNKIPPRTVNLVPNGDTGRDDPSFRSPSSTKAGLKTKLAAIARSIYSSPSCATRTFCLSSDVRPELPGGTNSVSMTSQQWVGGTVAEWDVHVRSVPCRKLKLSDAPLDQPPIVFPTSDLYVRSPRGRSTSFHSAGAGRPSVVATKDAPAVPPPLPYTYQNRPLPPFPPPFRSGAPSISDLIRDYKPSDLEKRLDNTITWLGSSLNVPQWDWVLWNRLACQVCTQRTGTVIPKRPKNLFFGPPGNSWSGGCTCEEE